MKKQLILVPTLFFAVLFFNSCEKENDFEADLVTNDQLVNQVSAKSQYLLYISDNYIDGTLSGENAVYLSVGGSFPNGTTYSWRIRRQNGSIQSYSGTTQTIRRVEASIANKITAATVTANFGDYSKTVTRSFSECPIPCNGGFGF